MNVIVSLLFQRESNLIIFWTYHFEITSSPDIFRNPLNDGKKAGCGFYFLDFGFLYL